MRVMPAAADRIKATDLPGRPLKTNHANMARGLESFKGSVLEVPMDRSRREAEIDTSELAAITLEATPDLFIPAFKYLILG